MVIKSAGEERVTVEIDAVDDLPLLYCDERHLRQILVNLLSNAVKFSNRGDVVHARVAVDEDDALEIQVIDRGIGIDDRHLPRVMERFGQIANALTREHPGTGLGLPIAHGLARLHGAELTIDSRLGGGTTVTIRFPSYRTVRPGHRASGG